MSKRRQQDAADRRDSASQRANNATERAALNRKRGDDLLVDLHEAAAETQRRAARAAEGQRIADVRIEGDQLRPDRGILADDDA